MSQEQEFKQAGYEEWPFFANAGGGHGGGAGKSDHSPQSVFSSHSSPTDYDFQQSFSFVLQAWHTFFFSATCSVESLNKERAQIFVPECWAHCVSIGAPWGVAYERLLMVAGILPQSIFTSLPFSNESNGKQKLASQSWTPLIYGQKDLNRVIHFPGLVQNIWCYKFLEMIVHPRVLQKYNLYLQKWPSNEQEMKASCSSSVTLPCFTDVS